MVDDADEEDFCQCVLYCMVLFENASAELDKSQEMLPILYFKEQPEII